MTNFCVLHISFFQDRIWFFGRGIPFLSYHFPLRVLHAFGAWIPSEPQSTFCGLQAVHNQLLLKNWRCPFFSCGRCRYEY
eukprot:g6679.t1